MTIKNHTYYQNFKNETDKNIRNVDYCIRQAERCKRLYYLTKDVRGYRWLNRLARRLNIHYVTRGFKLAGENLESCMLEIEYLSKFLEGMEGLA